MNNNQNNIKKPMKEDPYSSFTVGSFIILVILLLFFFFGWSYIYNTEYGVEIGINGWNYICLGFSHAYKSMNKVVFGDVDSFYYYVNHLVEAETIITFVSFLLAVTFLACFIVALVMTPKMVSGYCSGNKNCSVHSLALIPFFAALGNGIVNFVLLHKMGESAEIKY